MTNGSKLILANDFLRDTGKAVYVWFYLFYQLRFICSFFTKYFSPKLFPIVFCIFHRILWWLGKGKLPNSYIIFMVKKLQMNLTKKLV